MATAKKAVAKKAVVKKSVDVYAKPESAPSAALLAQQEENNQIQAIKNIFSTFTTIAIAAPLYLYHWGQTKKSA